VEYPPTIPFIKVSTLMEYYLLVQLIYLGSRENHIEYLELEEHISR
jgi:hypothetical protein